MNRSLLLALAVAVTVMTVGPALGSPKKASSPAASEIERDDAVSVSPDHYSVVLETETVRVLRIRYAPGESSAMHYHPEAVAVFLTDHEARLEAPDGTFQDVSARAGDAIVTPAGHHRGTNIGEEPYELLLVELKAPRQSGESD